MLPAVAAGGQSRCRAWPNETALSTRSACSTARARATRDETSSLAEDVAQVGLDRLLAEEQLRGDLGIRLAVDNEPCHLELAFGQRLDAGPVGLARPRATVDAMAKLSQLLFRFVPVAQRAARLERAGRALQLGGGTVTLAGFGEGAARERPRERRLDRRSRPRRRQPPPRAPARLLRRHPRRRGRRPPPLGWPKREPSGAVAPRPKPPRQSAARLRVGRAVEREPAARERLEVMGSRAPGDQHQVLAAGGPERATRPHVAVPPTREAHAARSTAASAEWKPSSRFALRSKASCAAASASSTSPGVQRCSGAAKEASRRARACCPAGAPPRCHRRAARRPRPACRAGATARPELRPGREGARPGRSLAPRPRRGWRAASPSAYRPR